MRAPASSSVARTTPRHAHSADRDPGGLLPGSRRRRGPRPAGAGALDRLARRRARPPRGQYAELLHDLGEHSSALFAYRGTHLRYRQVTFDGAAVEVADDEGHVYRSVFDFTRTSGPAVGVPYSIADWIVDGRGSSAVNGVLEMPLLQVPDVS
jgi:hypothetical protein